MAVLDRDEYLKRLGSIITGDTDEDLKNIEDFTDTFDDLLGKTDTENWKQKYEGYKTESGQFDGYITGHFEYCAKQFQCRISEFSSKGRRHITELAFYWYYPYGYASVKE